MSVKACVGSGRRDPVQLMHRLGRPASAVVGHDRGCYVALPSDGPRADDSRGGSIDSGQTRDRGQSADLAARWSTSAE